MQVGVTYTQNSFTGATATARAAANANLAKLDISNQHLKDFGAGDPEAVSGTFTWGSLDTLITRNAANRKTPTSPMCITLCRAPAWMTIGGAGGDAAVDPGPGYGIAGAVADKTPDFIDLCYRAIARYLPRGVRYFQVWNEMKGMWCSTTGVNLINAPNRWAYEAYVYMYNQLVTAVANDACTGPHPASGLIAAAGFTPADVHLGGPYANVSSAMRSNDLGGHQHQNVQVSGSWGYADMADWDVIDYHVFAAKGLGGGASGGLGTPFVCWDQRLKSNDLYALDAGGNIINNTSGIVRSAEGISAIPGTIGANPNGRVGADPNGGLGTPPAYVLVAGDVLTRTQVCQAFADLISWIKNTVFTGNAAFTTNPVGPFPLWNSEFHIGNDPYVISDANMGLLMTDAMAASSAAGLDTLLYWGTEGGSNNNLPTFVYPTNQPGPPSGIGGTLTPIGTAMTGSSPGVVTVVGDGPTGR